jgi:hypothetical protein
MGLVKTFSKGLLSDAHYQQQANVGLVEKFSVALPAPQAKSFKCAQLLSTKFIPLILGSCQTTPSLSALIPLLACLLYDFFYFLTILVPLSLSYSQAKIDNI